MFLHCSQVLGEGATVPVVLEAVIPMNFEADVVFQLSWPEAQSFLSPPNGATKQIPLLLYLLLMHALGPSFAKSSNFAAFDPGTGSSAA